MNKQLSTAEKKRQESIENILNTALRLFGNLGYNGTSISRIAKEAGISKGLMYNYFDSKEKLLEGILMKVGDESMEFFANVLSIEDPKEKFLGIINSTIKFLEEKTDYNKLITSLALQNASHNYIEQMRASKEEFMVESMIGILSELGVKNPEQEVYGIFACLDGMSIQFLITEDSEILHKVKESLITRYIK